MSRRLWLFNVSRLPLRFSGYCYCSSSDALCNPPAATAVGFSLRTKAHRQTICQTRLDCRRRAASTACTRTRGSYTLRTHSSLREHVHARSPPALNPAAPSQCALALTTHAPTRTQSRAFTHTRKTTALPSPPAVAISPPAVASRAQLHAPLKRPQSGTQIADATMTPQKTAYTVTRKLSST